MPDDVSIVKFTSTGKDTTGRAKNVTLSHGVRYYVTVEATNCAGMTSHGWSSGFTVDVTPPEITEVNKALKIMFLFHRGAIRCKTKNTNRKYLIFYLILKSNLCPGELPLLTINNIRACLSCRNRLVQNFGLVQQIICTVRGRRMISKVILARQSIALERYQSDVK